LTAIKLRYIKKLFLKGGKMHRGMMLIVLLAVLLSGCATTSIREDQDSHIEQLSNRISDLEAELKSKDEEISSLESLLKELRASLVKKPKESVDVNLSIRQIQTALKNAGFYKSTIDGKMGPKTLSAIKEFQEANGLKADGIVGRRTTEKLREYLL
jgi:peptidoglycan hydrolase-like protein with peptidoglycan-binding domain